MQAGYLRGSKRDLLGEDLYRPLTEVSAIEGGRALLPCDVTPPTPGDFPILVLFYGGATGLPIYSIDARSGPQGRSKHWSELGGRAHFDLMSSPSGLVIDEVAATDHGHYRCRVDFGSSPTRNLRVKLLVVVPPRRVSILSGAGLEVSGVIGPYPVGGSLTLTCQVTGGSPRPWVTWWHEGSLLDDVAEEVKGQVIRNILILPNLSRQHLYRVLTCQASNSNLSLPLAATVTLDMSFPPLEVKILGGKAPLSEGKRYSLVCEAGGSKPSADLTWYIDGNLMTDTKNQVLAEGNVSRSTLHLTPTRMNNGAVVSCRADNSLLQAAAVEDSRRLEVYYSPRLHLRAGQNLNMSNIKEGDDVYFECDIQANPPVYRVEWFLNGIELHQNVTAGVIQSNQSLVLQKKWVYGGGRQQPVNVTCQVEAHPEATTFRWAFNTSSEFAELPEDRVHSGRGRSLVVYTPQTHHDFGSLLCWGRNQVDTQHQPCVFHIVPAGVPEPVHNCSAWHNGSAAGEVVVACQAGWSGGLTQTFTLEVRHAPKGHSTPKGSTGSSKTHGSVGPGKLLASLKDQMEPHFTVTGLAPGTEYHLVVVASNAQGAAPSTVLVYLTPIDVAEKQTSAAAAEASESSPLASLAPIVGVVVGVVASLLVCSVVLVLVVRARTANTHSHSQTKIVYDKAAPGSKPDDGGFVQQQQQGPDIILVKSAVPRYIDLLRWNGRQFSPDQHSRLAACVPPDSQSGGETQQLVAEYRGAHDGSFHITPAPTPLTTGVLVARETDALLQDPGITASATTTGILPSEGGGVATSCPRSSSSSFLPPRTATSYYPEGRDTPPSSSCIRRSPSEHVLQGHPDLCPQDPPGCTSARTLVVTCAHGGSHESSV
ncbi:Synaptogenesis protein syg-2-like 3 [Homarus americanus]|uniref:Synaptogenesis protein syg-2-like 3 n=1 Tax=Homarus americanus TaxID=6706 RepID=A0A8J5MLV9_HOMAM|nr:Synaptogenesis protein syg-2-like 3 [Homarus americanus]